MLFRIEPSSSTPITRQLAEQIRARCAGRQLKPGDRLPSVRALAADLAVNQNTILRVYERLTAEGLLERRHGDGTYVADSLPAGRLRPQKEYLKQELRRLVEQGQMLGMSLEELQQAMADVFEVEKS
jgi:GntR family transcriptional regulator